MLLLVQMSRCRCCCADCTLPSSCQCMLCSSTTPSSHGSHPALSPATAVTAMTVLMLLPFQCQLAPACSQAGLGQGALGYWQGLPVLMLWTRRQRLLLCGGTAVCLLQPGLCLQRLRESLCRTGCLATTAASQQAAEPGDGGVWGGQGWGLSSMQQLARAQCWHSSDTSGRSTASPKYNILQTNPN